MSFFPNMSHMEDEDDEVFIWSGSDYVTGSGAVKSSPATEHHAGLESADSHCDESFVSYCPQMDPTNCFVPDMVFAEGAQFFDPYAQTYFDNDASVYGEAWMNYSPVAEQMDFTCDERNNREARQKYVPQLNPKLTTPEKKQRNEAKRSEQPAVQPVVVLPSVAAAAAAERAALRPAARTAPTTAATTAAQTAPATTEPPAAETEPPTAATPVRSIRRGISLADKQRLQTILTRAARSPVLAKEDTRSAASTTDDAAKESDARSATTDDVTKESDARSVTTDDITKESDVRSVATDDVAKDSDARNSAENESSETMHDEPKCQFFNLADDDQENPAQQVEEPAYDLSARGAAALPNGAALLRSVLRPADIVALRETLGRARARGEAQAEERTDDYFADPPVPARNDRELCGLCAEPVPLANENRCAGSARCSIM